LLKRSPLINHYPVKGSSDIIVQSFEFMIASKLPVGKAFMTENNIQNDNIQNDKWHAGWTQPMA